MSDDAITFLAIICSVIAFTVGLAMWQPHLEAVASAPKASRVTQTEPLKSSPIYDIRGGDVGIKG